MDLRGLNPLGTITHSFLLSCLFMHASNINAEESGQATTVAKTLLCWPFSGLHVLTTLTPHL